MKYKLLQKLPWMEVWTIIEWDKLGNIILSFWYTNISNIEEYPDFFEEVKEPKTIYDLKKGDTFWTIENCGYIQNWFMPFDYFEWFLDITRCFVTEREAKRNKLLRELATRMDKWLPSRGDPYITYTIDKPTYTYTIDWVWSNCDIVLYHMWLVFRGEKEYDKWITEEAKDLLFNI